MAVKQWKAVTIDWEGIEVYDNEAEIKICLSQREIAVLKAVLSPQYWATRWIGVVDMDIVDNFVATLDSKLDGDSCAMTTCDEVANCIDTSPDVQSAIQNFTTNNYSNGGIGNPEEALPDSVRNTSMLPSVYSCDLDHLWATCTQIVDAVNESTTEVFQAIEILTNPAELAAEIADNVPVAEIAGIAVEVALWIQDSAYEAYELAWSTVVRDEIACELFCHVKEHDPCSITFNDVWGIYMDGVSDLIPPPLLSANFYDWYVWLISLPFNLDLLTVKIGGLAGLICMLFGSKFGGFILGIKSLETVIALAADNSDPDWAILCTDCPITWHHYWNFETHDNALDDWDDDVSLRGTIVSGSGIESVQYQSGQYWNEGVTGVTFGEIPDASTEGFRVYATVVRGDFSLNPDSVILRALPFPNKVYKQGQVFNGDQKFYIDWDGNAVDVSLRQIVASITDGTGNLGSIIVRGVELWGLGIDPYILRLTGNVPF